MTRKKDEKEVTRSIVKIEAAWLSPMLPIREGEGHGRPELRMILKRLEARASTRGGRRWR
jgi:hypothetical protein